MADAPRGTSDEGKTDGTDPEAGGSLGAGVVVEEDLGKPIMAMHNPPHPGGIVKRQCLEPLGLTVTAGSRPPYPSTSTPPPELLQRLRVGQRLHIPHRLPVHHRPNGQFHDLPTPRPRNIPHPERSSPAHAADSPPTSARHESGAATPRPAAPRRPAARRAPCACRPPSAARSPAPRRPRPSPPPGGRPRRCRCAPRERSASRPSGRV